MCPNATWDFYRAITEFKNYLTTEKRLAHFPRVAMSMQPLLLSVPPPEIINDKARQFIQNKIGETFESFSSFYDVSTMELLNVTAAEEYFGAIHQHVDSNIGKLCRTRLILGRIRYKRKNRNLAERLADKVDLIWSELRDKVQSFCAIFVDHYLDEPGNGEDYIRTLVSKWSKFHGNYRYFIDNISPFLDYVVLNYPPVTKEVTRELTINDFLEVYLINLLRLRLATSFRPFLEAFVSSQRETPNLVRADLEVHTPLTLMYRYRISVDEDLSLKEFYFHNVSLWANGSIHIPIDLAYCESLKKVLTRNALITGTISAILISEANEIVLRATLTRQDTLCKIIVVLKDSFELHSAEAVCPEIASQLNIIFETFESRSMLEDLSSAYLHVTKSALERASNEGLEEALKEACKLVLLANKSEELLKATLLEILSFFGGSVGLMDRYLRICELAIRKNGREGIEHNAVPPNYDNELSILVPVILRIPAKVLDLYSRSLFRRYVLRGPTVADSIRSNCYLEHHLFKLFERLYGLTPEYDRLQSLVTEVLTSSHLSHRFAAEPSASRQPMIPLILEKSKVPHVFQENANTNVTLLTEEMQRSWDELERFYRRVDKRAEFKKLYLIEHLQHFEVETGFFLSNGKPLVLDLSSPQVQVLSLFNEADSLKYDKILREARLGESIIQEVLRSFVKIGLFLSSGDTYFVNDSFSADEYKIRNGLLRVRMGFPDAKDTSLKKMNNALHLEGQLSYWKQELIMACITRSLKGESRGLKANDLYAKVRSQINGTSVGEFKDALKKTVDDKIITKWRNYYRY